MSAWNVNKFGGTSLAEADGYRNCANIILNHVSSDKKIMVVVSAMGDRDPIKLGKYKKNVDLDVFKPQPLPQQPSTEVLLKVTSSLIKAHELAAKRDSSYLAVINELKSRHLKIVDELLDFDGRASAEQMMYNNALRMELKQLLEGDFQDLSFILRSVWLGKQFDLEHWAHGYGEIWSARLMTGFISYIAHNQLNKNDSKNQRRKAVFLDAREVISTLKEAAPGTPDMKKSEARLNEWLSDNVQDNNTIVVCTGYIASDHMGKPVTLGRDGSDYSASIVAALLHAESCTIWTDVDGVYSAHPGLVKKAVIRPLLTYSEASELAYFGAKVIHPKTMTPAVVEDIPIWLRNSFNPSAPGTCIQSLSRMESNTTKGSLECVQGFSCIENLALVCVEGTGMVGVPGMALRLFQALKQSDTSVVLISQAGSEHSICLAIPDSQADSAVKAVRRELRDELEWGQIQSVTSKVKCCCLAVVGEGMRSTVGVAGRTFSALSDAGINIIAIAQGSSERNISIIIPQADSTKGLQAVHNAFVEDPTAPLVSPSLNRTKENKAPPPLDLSTIASLEERKQALLSLLNEHQAELNSIEAKLLAKSPPLAKRQKV